MHSGRPVRGLAPVLLALCALPTMPTASQAYDITTYHYDAQRTGLNNTETALTPATVSSSAFRQLQKISLPTGVDAQPLVISAATMASWGYASQFPHDVVYLADEANNIFAIDSVTGAVLLQKNFGTPVAMQNLPGNCSNNTNTVGINSTPVIDTAARVMYFVTYTWESNLPVYRIHEMNLLDLSEKIPSVVVAATGHLSDGSTVNFAPGSERQRPALLMANGAVYAAFGSFCDLNTNIARGWLLGWQTNTLTPLAAAELTQQQTAAQSVNPLGGTGPFFMSAIWMSGYGPAADSAGYVYFQTGNSDGVKANNLPDSVVRVTPNLSTVNDYYTPYNFAFLDGFDYDRGSGGVMVVPDQPGGQKFAVSQGKDGGLYLLNRTTGLGGYVLGGPDVPPDVFAGGCWCGPTYFVGSDGQPRVVSTGGTQVQTWLLPTTASGPLTPEATAPELPDQDGQDPGFMSTTSSNGTAANSAVIWSLSRSSGSLIYLQAVAATPGGGATAVYDKAGRTWSFGSATAIAGYQVLLNHSPAYGQYGVDIVIDSSGTAWVMNAQNGWYSFNGSGWTLQTTTPVLAVPSPAGAPITPASGGNVVDGSGNVWSFGTPTTASGNEVLINGAPAFGAYGVKIVIDTSGTMWHTNAFGGWWYFNGTGWSYQASGPNFYIPSRAGSSITPASGGVITDRWGRIFSFGSPLSFGGNAYALVDGAPAYGGYAVKMVLDVGGNVWATPSFGGWWIFNGKGWTSSGGPLVPPAWKPGDTVTTAGRLPRAQIVPAGQWAVLSANPNLVPVVANGRVYVASYAQLTIWGLAD